MIEMPFIRIRFVWESQTTVQAGEDAINIATNAPRFPKGLECAIATSRTAPIAEFGWQYLFPSSRLSVETPHVRLSAGLPPLYRRHHIHEKGLQKGPLGVVSPLDRL